MRRLAFLPVLPLLLAYPGDLPIQSETNPPPTEPTGIYYLWMTGCSTVTGDHTWTAQAKLPPSKTGNLLLTVYDAGGIVKGTAGTEDQTGGVLIAYLPDIGGAYPYSYRATAELTYWGKNEKTMTKTEETGWLSCLPTQ